MNKWFTSQAGSAFFWRGIQLVGSKLIFLARTFILARILTPEDFGLMAITLVAVDSLTRITELGMIQALVQRSDVDEIHFNSAWTIGLIRSILISAIVFVSAPYISIIFAEPRATDLIRLASIKPVLEAFASIKIAQITRELHFRAITTLRLIDGIINTIVSILTAPIIGVWSLIVGTLSGLIAFLILSYILAPHRPHLSIDRNALSSLVRFGQWIFFSSIISVVAGSLIQVVISRRLGVAELGLYFLASKLAFIPSEVSGELIGSVAFPIYSRLQDNLNQAVRVFRSMLIIMWALILPICALLIALAPILVNQVLGTHWQGTISLIRILAFVNIIGLLGDSISPILKGIGQPNKVTIIEAFQSTLLISLIWSLAGAFGVSGAAISWLIAVGASQIISIIFIRKILPDLLNGLFLPMSLIVISSGVGGILAVWISGMYSGIPGLLVGSIIASTIIGVLFWVVDRVFDLQLLVILSKAFPQVATWIRLSPGKS